MQSHQSRFAFVGPYPPTVCGIATFTQSLRNAFAGAATEQQQVIVADVIRLVDDGGAVRPPEVVTDWVRDDRESLAAAVETASSYDALIVQHEFGIFGGRDGVEAVEFVNACPVPVTVVLHTVLPDPTAHQRSIIESLVASSRLTVVQSQTAKRRLCDSHMVDPALVVVIPHGAVANFHGPTIDLPVDEQPVLFTWGLLGPGKGLEHAIRALAVLAERGPVPTYVIAGRTHPNVLAANGEQYRDGLEKLAADLGVGSHVVFDDKYRSWDELRTMMRSCDIVVLPYDSRDQVTSGVLVEALASARPVVATAFPHALEALQSGAGVVVPHEDPVALADAIGDILEHPARQRRMSLAAQAEATSWLWPRVGRDYLDEVMVSAQALEVA